MKVDTSRTEQCRARSEIDVLTHHGGGTVLPRVLIDKYTRGSIEFIIGRQVKGSHSAGHKIEHMALPGMGCSFEE